MGYLASAANIASSNPCAGPSPRIKITIFLLSAWAAYLISALIITAFLPMVPSVNRSSERESTVMP